ncbi:MAG: VWA domain-containing protein [Planctomycetota bacterium]
MKTVPVVSLLCLLAAASLASAADDPATLVGACDPFDWSAAKLGRKGLLEGAGLGDETLIALTGGGLVSSGSPEDAAFAWPVAMLEAAGFDVVNLAHRDLVGDASQLAKALGESKIAFVSANLALPDGVATPWKAFVVIERGGVRTAFVGVTARSASMARPESGAIEGLTVSEPRAAIQKTLGLIRGKADRVILLADARPSEVAGWLSGLDGVEAALVSSRGGASHLMAQRQFGAPSGGRGFTVLTFGKGAPAAKQILLVEPVDASKEYEAAAKRFGIDTDGVELGEPSAKTTDAERTLARLEPGKTHPILVVGENRAARLTLTSVALLNRFGDKTAPEGTRFLVVGTRWENILTPEVVREQLVPVAYKIPKLSDHLYGVADGRAVLPPAPTDGVAGLISWDGLTLPLPGSRARGRLLFLVPEGLPLANVEIRFYDYAHGPMTLGIVRAGAVVPDEPIVPAQSNVVLEAGVFAIERTPANGRTSLTVELRAKSRFMMDADATAYDPKAKPGDRIEVGTVADWKDWRRHTQLLLDGEYAYALRSTSFPKIPRFLPDLMSGGTMSFDVPSAAGSLELYCGMPNALLPGSGKVVRPELLVFAIEGKRPALPERPALVSIDDEVFGVAVTGQRVLVGEGSARFYELSVTVSNTGEKGETFRPFAQLACVDEKGTEHAVAPASAAAVHPPMELLWIPRGERRSFEVWFAIPESVRTPRLSYRGVSLAEILELPPVTGDPAKAPSVPAEPAPPADPDPAREEPGESPPAGTPEARPVDRPDGLAALPGTVLPGFRAAAVTGETVELSVLDARLVAEVGKYEAGKEETFLLLQTRWRKLDRVKVFRGRQIRYTLHLHREGKYLVPLWSHVRRQGKDVSHFELDDENDTIVLTAIFEVRKGPLADSALVFSPKEGPGLVVPFAPSGRKDELPVLAHAGNELVEFTVHGFAEPTGKVIEEIGSYLSKEQELIGIRVSARSRLGPVDLKRADLYVQLIAGDRYPCPMYYWPEKELVEEVRVWPRRRMLIPPVRQHGVLLFAVPDRKAKLTLEVHLPNVSGPDGEPLPDPVLVLPIQEGAVEALPGALSRIEENGWEVRLLGLSTFGSIEEPEVVADIWMRAPAGVRTREFQPSSVQLLDQAGKKQERHSMERKFESPDRLYLPPGRARRFEIRYVLREVGSHLWLRLPDQCPKSEIALPNPWVVTDRASLAEGASLPVTEVKEKLPGYSPPPLLPEPEPKGIEGVDLTGRQINEAIRKGAGFLLELRKDGFSLRDKEDALVILALLHSGEIQKAPEAMAMAVSCLSRRKIAGTYDGALTIMALADLDPDRYRPRIEKIAQALVDGQCATGRWGYLTELMKTIKPEAAAEAPAAGSEGRIEVLGGEPIPGWSGGEKAEERTLARTLPLTKSGGDNSCSQYAVLGLLAAAKAGVKAPRETWERAAAWFLDSKTPRRGWGYGHRGNSTGSMTTAGLAGLAVSRHGLGGEIPGADVALREGVDWLGRSFRLAGNPQSTSWHYYYLYGLERAGRLLGKEFFGGNEWYPMGARYLVDNQAGSGSWTGIGGSNDEIRDTAFALLFLTLATEKLGEEKKVPTGPGSLEVLSSGLGGSVVFILDASGSMGASLGTETRFDAARRVLLQVLEGSGQGLEVALRVYGHRFTSNKPEAKTDSELVVGFGAPDRPELEAAVRKLRCRGKTPLTHSLREALKDLAQARNPKRRVVLLTDGLESDRRAKPLDAAAELAGAGVRLDVVCLAMDSTDMLGRMAEKGGGTCYAANDAEQLMKAIRAALLGEVAFRVMTPDGKEVAKGKSGERIELPAGPYVVEIELPDGPARTEAWVHQDRVTRLRVR